MTPQENPTHGGARAHEHVDVALSSAWNLLSEWQAFAVNRADWQFAPLGWTRELLNSIPLVAAAAEADRKTRDAALEVAVKALERIVHGPYEPGVPFAIGVIDTASRALRAIQERR